MKYSIIRGLALMLALAMPLSSVGLAEALPLNGPELPKIDIDGLSLEEAFIGDGDDLALPDFGGEIELPETSDETGEAPAEADGDTGGVPEAAAPDAPEILENPDGTVDEPAASIDTESAQNDLLLIDGEIEDAGGAGEWFGQVHRDIPGARADNADLADTYLRGVLPGFHRHGRTMASPNTGRHMLVKKGLTTTTQLYDALKPMLVEVAEGKRSSTEFKFDSDALGTQDHWWTPQDLGIPSFDDDGLGEALLEKEAIDTYALMTALLQDFPYHLYWFDKTQGCSTLYGWSSDGSRVQLSVLQIKLTVANDYAADTYTVNALPAYVSAAVSNIDQAIRNNVGKGDFDKLTAYADLICGYVEYNHPAVEDDTPYGDPWQLVWIFDGEEDTKVVCEGYAKGFKYLCDLSDFRGDVGCALVNGMMYFGTGEGPHMWNSLKMPDGQCYLVDLTNCDDGKTCDYSLFLKGCNGEAGGPYVCNGLRYEFDSELSEQLGEDTSWLTYSKVDYDPSAPVPDPTTAPTVKPSVVPTVNPTAAPTAKPTVSPTVKPSVSPTIKPTEAPTAKPTEAPTAKPTEAPTAKPTVSPSVKPTEAPTAKPTETPTAKPTEAPTAKPTEAPTAKPTEAPTAKPTEAPTAKPTESPTVKPTVSPTVKPTEAPTAKPTATSTADHTAAPTARPTAAPKVDLSKCKLTVKDQTYTGKSLKPAVTVKYGSKKLKKGTDYTVSYKKNKAVGTATVTVKGKDGYTGTKKVTFKILPRTVTISKLTAGKQRLTVKWAKRAEATGYELQYAMKRSFAGARTVRIKKNTTVSATVKKLKTGKTYYIRLRSYKTVNKKTYCSVWSKGKSAKVK